MVGKADLKQELQHYLPQWGWKRSVDEFLNDWFYCEDQVNKQLINRIQQFRQQNIPCYLATNQEKYRTAYILNYMGFAKQFDGTFSSAYVGYMKRDRAFFEHVLHVLKDVKAQEILFWDDIVENVEVARQTGLRAEIYTTFEEFEKNVEVYLSA
jgi:putative hydrolase of the HAD superfamily